MSSIATAMLLETRTAHVASSTNANPMPPAALRPELAERFKTSNAPNASRCCISRPGGHRVFYMVVCKTDADLFQRLELRPRYGKVPDSVLGVTEHSV